ncbi:MAG: 4Fe-4S ferredoxin [wastewater metagenome]|nr:4Fe-4S ferredoxin [Candidatus Loosdrechtia aerotolerans]
MSGCPGSRTIDFSEKENQEGNETGSRPSQLRQWPIQLHLVSPLAPYFQGKDVLLSADCVAYALGDFHKDYLKGKSLAIACPKLDSEQEIYIEKIKSLIDDAKINTLTILIMQVPCCFGLVQVAKEGAEKASRKIPVKQIVVGLEGNILSEEWI